MTRGSPGVPRKSTPVIERILPHLVESPNGCWLWPRATNGVGYGVVGLPIDGRWRMGYVHRIVYEHFRGPIPDGLQIDHLCRVRNCANPDHLEPVTRRVNLLRGMGVAAKAAIQTHCPQGHPYDEVNTGIQKDGSRKCRTCVRERLRAYRATPEGYAAQHLSQQKYAARNREKIAARSRAWRDEKRTG